MRMHAERERNPQHPEHRPEEQCRRELRHRPQPFGGQHRRLLRLRRHVLSHTPETFFTFQGRVCLDGVFGTVYAHREEGCNGGNAWQRWDVYTG